MTLRDIAIRYGVEVDNNSFNNATSMVNKLGTLAKNVLGAIAITFSVRGLVEFGKDCVQTASDISEMESKFEVVFGNMTDTVDKWAEDYANAIGRNKSTIKTYLADQQNLLVGFTDGSEKARAEAATLSEDMTSLALDIASFANTDEDEAVERMTKAVMGESEAAKGLGAVLNDLTRAEAMHRMGIEGKFNDLDQYTKMTVNLNAIQYQSKDAIGDCANSMDRYESKTRQLSSKIKDLKELIGSKLLPIMSKLKSIEIAMVDTISKVTKKLLGENDEVNNLQTLLDKLSAKLAVVKPMFDRLGETISRATVHINNLITKVGGVGKAFKLAGAIAAAFWTYMNWGTIVKGVSSITRAVIGLGRMLLGVNLIAVAGIMVLIAVFLLIEDFIAFMQGKDSVIGEAFKQAGIDAEEMRDKVKHIASNLKTIFGNIANGIKKVFAPIFAFIKEKLESIFNIDLSNLGTGVEAIIEFFDRITTAIAENEEATETFGKIVGVIMAIVGAVLVAIPVVNTIISIVIGAIGVFNAITGAIATIVSAIGTVIAVISAAVGAITAPILAIIAAIIAWVAICVYLVKNHEEVKAKLLDIWGKIKDQVKGRVQELKEALAVLWENIRNKIVDKVTSMHEKVQTTFDNMISGIKEKVDSIKDTVKNGMDNAIQVLIDLPGKALTWGKDFIGGFVDGIKEKVSAVTDAVTGVADKVKSVLHFSRPDEGPLRDYEQWAPDFMSGFAKGISDNKHLITDNIKDLAKDMSRLTMSATANIGTALNSTTSNTSTTLNQTVNISNDYKANGGSSVKQAMKQSSHDATAEMARGLAFARG